MADAQSGEVIDESLDADNVYAPSVSVAKPATVPTGEVVDESFNASDPRIGITSPTGVPAALASAPMATGVEAAAATPVNMGAPGPVAATQGGVATVNGTQVALNSLSPEMRDKVLAQSVAEKQGQIGISIPDTLGAPVARPGGGGEMAQLERRQQSADRASAAEMQKAAEAEKAAIRAKATVDTARADEEAKLAIKQQADQNKIVADAADHKSTVDGQMTHYADMRDTLVREQGNMIFDPNRYEKNMSVGQKILTVLSIGLGGIGGARSIGGSGGNIGTDLFNNAIANDVAAQKEAYARKGQQIERASSAYATARQRGLDDEHATQIARMASIETYKAGLNVIGTKYKTPEIEAERQARLAEANKSYAESRQKYDDRSMAHALTFANNRQQQRHQRYEEGIQLAQLGIQQQNADAKLAAAEAKANAKPPMSIPGWKGAAATPDAYNKAAEMVGTQRVVHNQLQGLISYREKYGTEIFDRQAIAEAQSVAGQLLTTLKDQYHLGVLSAQDEKLLERITGDPTAVEWTGSTLNTLKALQKKASEDAEDRLDAYGFRRDPTYKPPVHIDAQPIEGGK